MPYSDRKNPLPRQPGIFKWWLLWVGFVIYGSLVPLIFVPLPLDEAVARFLRIAFLHIGVGGRADWIANGVLYVPVGFLTTAMLAGSGSNSMARLLAGIAAAAFSCSLAVGVEFMQVFFPQRTVSQNDIIAEFIGSMVGILLALGASGAFRRLLSTLSDTALLSTGRLLKAYALGYLAYSLFPYDLVISTSEFTDKLGTQLWGWIAAGSNLAQRPIVFMAKLLTEILTAVPLGLLRGHVAKSERRVRIGPALVTGAALGLVLEVAQLFLESGVSQGVSVLTRSAGFGIGVAIWNKRRDLGVLGLKQRLARLAPALFIPYLILLPAVSGWFDEPWMGIHQAADRLTGEVHFLPFYYHYYTTEAKALFSLASVALMYVPVGVLGWARSTSPARGAVAALCLSSVIEVGKLFTTGAHPDPTNLLIAVFAAWTTIQFMQRLEGKKDITGTSLPTESKAAGNVLVAGVLFFALLWLIRFPTQPLILTLAFAIYCGAIWFRPVMILLVIPAALPLLDLAPWSGRFFFDEFDLLVIVSAAIGYVRVRQPGEQGSHISLAAALVGIFALSFAISVCRAVWPLSIPGINAFNNYFSPYNALRIGKGVLGACVLMGLIQRFRSTGQEVMPSIGGGMIAGLAGTVAFILWERTSFTELLNYSSAYRVTGPISAMHTGGAYIECLLTVSTAFLLQAMLQTRSRIGRLSGFLLMLGASYALMVTFSRNGYLAYAVMLAIMLILGMRQPQWRERGMLLGVSLAAATCLVAASVLLGSFAQSRLATVSSDYGTREAHWSDALNIRDTDWGTALFGMGIGRFPETHYWRTGEAGHIAAYQLLKEPGNVALEIGTGDPVYMDQLIHIQSRQTYVLSLDAKAAQAGASTSILLCHKWLLSSYDCNAHDFRLTGTRDNWQHFEARIDSGNLGGDPWYASRPVKMTLMNTGKVSIALDNIKLVSPEGKNILANGDFEQGLDHWSFTSDHHLAWHIKTLPVSVFFDMGAFGLLSLGALLIVSLWKVGGPAWRGSLEASAVLAALAGFLVVGVFDTLVDSPRMLLLLLLLAWLALTSKSMVRMTAGVKS